MSSIKEGAGSSFKEIHNKMVYNGDVVLFETGSDFNDEMIRQKLASQIDSDTYEVLKLLHIVSNNFAL